MKASLISILYLSVSLFLSLPFPSLSDRCNPNDKKALLQFKQSLNNPVRLSSWNPHTDCCEWNGEVECDPNTNRIISLSIFNGNVSGQIPSAIGDLPYLETVIIEKLSNLTGPIPSVIAKLSNLKHLTLSHLNLNGPVPSFLSGLKNLTYINLSFNKLTGSIPPSLSQLSDIDVIHLNSNRLTGTIPDSFGKFTGKVPTVVLNHNQLTGPVPKSLGDLNFTVIDITHNKLRGDVSFLFGTNKTLQIVYLSNNMFKFDISKVEFPENVTTLMLDHNRITGSLPASLTSLQMNSFDVSYNRLCGQIPIGGNLQNFESSVYLHNRCLCGAPLPPCK